MALKSNIPTIRKGLDPATARGIYRAAGYVRDVHRQIAPVDEGDWRDSAELVPDQPALTVEVQAGGARAPHGIIVEYGDPSNPNYPAQPTLGPAAKAIKPEIEVAKELRALIKDNAL